MHDHPARDGGEMNGYRERYPELQNREGLFALGAVVKFLTGEKNIFPGESTKVHQDIRIAHPGQATGC